MSAINDMGDRAVIARSSDADTCRRNGWDVGTLLIGDEGYGPDVIRLTAVGEHLILARCIYRNGVAIDRTENSWTLSCREWSEATDRCARCGASIPPYDVEDMQVCDRCDQEMSQDRKIQDFHERLADIADTVHALQVNPLRRKEKRAILADLDRRLAGWRSVAKWGYGG